MDLLLGLADACVSTSVDSELVAVLAATLRPSPASTRWFMRHWNRVSVLESTFAETQALFRVCSRGDAMTEAYFEAVLMCFNQVMDVVVDGEGMFCVVL